MKNFATIKTLFVGLLLVSLHLACNDDDDTIPAVPSTTITSLASQNENSSSLVAALSAADGGLPWVLQGEGPFTVLAPTNAAFEEFLDGRALGDIPSDVLTQVLLNHVISSKVKAADLVGLTSEGTFYTSTLADGVIADTKMRIYFKTDGGVQFRGVFN